MKNNPLDEHLREALKADDLNNDANILLPIEAAQALITAVKQAAVIEDRYWDINQLAEYLGISPRTAQRHFISDPRWPKPITYGNPKQRSKRWLASECRKALLLFRRD